MQRKVREGVRDGGRAAKFERERNDAREEGCDLDPICEQEDFGPLSLCVQLKVQVPHRILYRERKT